MNRSWVIPVGIVIVVVVLLVCCICAVLGIGFMTLLPAYQQSSGNLPFPDTVLETPTATPRVIRPVRPSATAALASPNPDSTGQPAPTPAPLSTPELPASAGAVPTDTLKTLEEAVVPISDLRELAERLGGKSNIPATLQPPAAPLQPGEKKSFWVTNTDTNENFQISATLQHVSTHVYFWVQDGVNFNRGEMVRLANTFDDKIYPTDREFFGSEWSPGIDGDPRIYILYAQGLGASLAGYFSSPDEYPPQAHQFSNGHEMFLLSADTVDLGDEFAYSVLAHEFQHMIHWYRDRNEDTWMNEGFSEVAAFLNGYGVGMADYVYTRDPDMQLTYWPSGIENTTPHYGAAFLFLTYFLDRFGEDLTKALVADPLNGMVSIDEVLAKQGIVDPLTKQPVGADNVFADWVVASYLKNPRVGDGRYTYHNYPDAPQPEETERISSCPSGVNTREVSQYGVDYISIPCRGAFTLNFEGSIQVGVVPEDPYSGSYAFWSNQGDESDMTLTRTFDFTNHSGPLTFEYRTWYDLEKDYDYAYLEASLDGKTWEILNTPSGTGEDVSGNSYGWGYNGESGGWIHEQVDISQYAGKQVQLRFEYVTDAAVNLNGLMLDDIAVPEINYSTDLENDEGGWQADGFVRIQNVLPQTFQLSLIRRGEQTTVENIPLSWDNTAQVQVEIGGDVNEVILVVSGTTRFTRQKAAYNYSLTK